MTVDRRLLMLAGLVGGLATAASGARAKTSAGPEKAGRAAMPAGESGLEPNVDRDQTAPLQRAIDGAAARGVPLSLPPGRYQTRGLDLGSGAQVIGANGLTVLQFIGDQAFISATGAQSVRLAGLTLDGQSRALAADGLVTLTGCADAMLRDVEVKRSAASGIVMRGSSGTIRDCRVSRVAQAGIWSHDAGRLEIVSNRIADAGNNGILVWRSLPGDDGTMVSGNRIERIAAEAGGSGQNGNGINIFRANGVLVTGNWIDDCAYSAVRANAASDVQIASNHCSRIGEVALYAEFGFEGALISGNVIDGAASGISVTNFNEGGRLAVIQGNLIRNLRQRLHEPVDKRGDGIAVEADATVTGNTIENAPSAGILVGWGRWMRDVGVSANVIRNAGVGIAVSSEADAGRVLVTGNMISGAGRGAIRAHARGTLHGADLIGGLAGTRVTIVGNVAG